MTQLHYVMNGSCRRALKLLALSLWHDRVGVDLELLDEHDNLSQPAWKIWITNLRSMCLDGPIIGLDYSEGDRVAHVLRHWDYDTLRGVHSSTHMLVLLYGATACDGDSVSNDVIVDLILRLIEATAVGGTPKMIHRLHTIVSGWAACRKREIPLHFGGMLAACTRVLVTRCALAKCLRNAPHDLPIALEDSYSVASQFPEAPRFTKGLHINAVNLIDRFWRVGQTDIDRLRNLVGDAQP